MDQLHSCLSFNAHYPANECEAVETWVRKPGAFSLQTSADHFYPDFPAKLKDGRLLAVEYKSDTSTSASMKLTSKPAQNPVD